MSRSNEQTILIDKFVGKKILDFRISRGIPRKAMAEAIGVTHQQLQKYEYAINRISASRLVLVAQYLEVPVIEFFEISEIEDCENKITNLRLSLEISRNLASINNPRFKETINQLLKTYKKDQEN